MLKLIRVTGVSLDDEDSQGTLEIGTVEMLGCVLENKGALVQLTDFPLIKEDGDFVYFEAIFKSNKDLNSYLNHCRG